MHYGLAVLKWLLPMHEGWVHRVVGAVRSMPDAVANL